MTTVYMVQHVHHEGLPGEDSKLIGFFTTKAKAIAAIKAVIDQPGFRDYPDGFEINAVPLDKTWWPRPDAGKVTGWTKPEDEIE